MVTMRDVAVEAGVSPMTVSNALTGRRPVSDVTRRKVYETVERLGYQINVAARNLRQGRTGTIGIAVPGLDSQYYGQLSHRLVKAFARAGWSAVVEQTGASREGELAAFTYSRLNAYDGLVMSPVGLSDDEIKTMSGDLPLVVLGERPLDHVVDRVGMDNLGGSRAATRLLLDRGCRDLVFLGVPALTGLATSDVPEGAAFVLRARGFLDAVDVAAVSGLSVRSAYAGATMRSGAEAVAELLAHGRTPDGIVCATDTLALGAVRALADRRISVPHDVRVVGFDDIEEAAFSTPSLSSVDPGHDAMVEEVVRLLGARLQDRSIEASDVTTGFRLVERESTGS